ncbi:hypothetical protein [Streptomyces sp. NRRL WC-3742]|uniref:hypothetical protein n=1 Tax=Streptomyces sp. NRRL WC-3742 TaxID=1463934 RepID=UPI0004C8C545|nr:hypothetical protein [Streptomyces sp. NRRL WC-3742]
MASTCGPESAPIGDVGTALMVIDSRLKSVYEGRGGSDARQQALVNQVTASLGPNGLAELVDGTCTVIYLYMTWLKAACDDHDRDVVEHVVPALVGTMRMMPRTFSPEVIPTMTGLLVAAGTGLSPNLWRAQYGPWTRAEMNPLEALAVMTAEHVNRVAGDDHDFATRLISDALARMDDD